MKATIKNLMCCGNCRHRDFMDDGDYSMESCGEGYVTQGWQRCSKWEFDGCTAEKRLEK